MQGIKYKENMKETEGKEGRRYGIINNLEGRRKESKTEGSREGRKEK